MKRKLLKPGLLMLVLLVVGGIINVAVAWAAPYVFREKYQVTWSNGITTYEWELYSDRGWPLASLSTDDRQPGTYFLQSDFDLPYWPIWLGFAINTIFYAAIVWVLWFCPGRMRRWRRIKRGLCPACAYPVGTNPRCTECGKPVDLEDKGA